MEVIPVKIYVKMPEIIEFQEFGNNLISFNTRRPFLK
jgi:hypothetical protein